MDNDLIFKVNTNIELAKQQLYVTGNKSYALEILNDSVLIKPSDYNIWQLLGSAYLMNKNFDMSNMCFKTALQINSDSIEANCGMAWYYSEVGKFKKAKKLLKQHIASNKDSKLAKFYLSIIEKLTGNHKSGNHLYENREKLQWLRKYSNNKFYERLKKIPELKTNIKNLNSKKTIIVFSEQGYGDQIMYARYLKKVYALGHKVIFIVNEKLYDLFNNSKDLENIIITEKLSSNLINCTDFITYQMSLPYLLEDNQNNCPPPPLSIQLSENKFEKVNNELSSKFHNLLNNDKLKIGIAWSGRPSQPREIFRSLDPSLIEKFLNIKNVNFFSLQQLNGSANIEFVYENNNYHDCSKYINTFMDTAFFVNKMDMIISTCTSLVHLSGSMRKNTYLLLSRIPDSRWGLRGSQKIYPSVKLLRQKKLNNWHYPLSEIRKIIKEKLTDL